jgi:hypothetical protein
VGFSDGFFVLHLVGAVFDHFVNDEKGSVWL